MKGFLKKDLALLRNTGKVYFAVVGMGIILGLVNKEMRSFSSSFIMIMLALTGVSTLSYDDFENGMPFLMSLPVSRKTYVKEKYLICFLSGAVGLVIAAVLGAVIFKMPLTHGEEPLLFVFPVYFAIAEIMTAVMIPTRIKFGPEKSRIVGMGIVIAIFLAIFCIGYLFKLFSVDTDALIRAVRENIPNLALVLGVIAFYIAIMLISYTFSVKALEKKEF